MSPWDFDGSSRVLVLVPHPDDETLATAGLLQKAGAAGATVRVVFLTDGENNPWPQRLMERRWRIGQAERARWGRLRRREALAALGTLGVSRDDVVFLGLADQTLTEILLDTHRDAVTRLSEIIRRWRPSLLVSPSPRDLHPDHSAAAVLVHFALARLSRETPSFARVEYLVHTRPSRKRGPHALLLPLSSEQRARKRRAILCHASQLPLRPRSLLARARSTEAFLAAPQRPSLSCEDHPVRKAVVRDGRLQLELVMRPGPGAFGRVTLYFVASNHGQDAAKLFTSLPDGRRFPRNRHRVVSLRDLATNSVVLTGQYRGDRRRGRLWLPHRTFARMDRVFVKLERRWGFFDEAGWRELPLRISPSLSGRGAGGG